MFKILSWKTTTFQMTSPQTGMIQMKISAKFNALAMQSVEKHYLAGPSREGGALIMEA